MVENGHILSYFCENCVLILDLFKFFEILLETVTNFFSFPGLPKPRPHMLLGIIVRVTKPEPKSKLPKEIADSSPEMVIPTKKKKKKKDKRKVSDT